MALKRKHPTLIRTGDEIASGEDVDAIKLEGERGSGKTSFALLLGKQAWSKAHKLLYGRPIDREIYHDTSPEAIEQKLEAAKRVLFCIIDVDVEGTDKQLRRDDLVPVELRGRFRRAKVMDYSTLISLTDTFMDIIKAHKDEYPGFGFATFLHVEGGGKIWEYVMDEWARKTDPSGSIDNVADLREKKMLETRRKGGKLVPVFERGPREEFGGINMRLIKYMDYIKYMSRSLGFNLTYTSLIQEKDKYENGERVGTFKKILGRPEIIDPYFDIILRFEKEIYFDVISEGRKKLKIKRQRFWVDAMDGKIRSSFAFRLDWTDQMPSIVFEKMASLLEDSPFRYKF